MKKSVIWAMAALMTTAIACDKEDNDDNNSSTTSSLKMNISNLGELGADERYEGWIIVNGSPVSTGTFSVSSSGAPSQTSFEVVASDLEAATDYVLSIEPFPDNDPAPSAIKIAGGSFSGNNAAVSVNHPAALNADFNTASGKYILATPTTTDMSDENSGIWFLDISSGSPMTGLNLPELPTGWVYEGWVVLHGEPITTGRFTDVDMADMAAPFSGSDASGPPFPGEDFVTNAPSPHTFPTDLKGATAVISIEPEPDNSPMPFAFKPLVNMISSSAMDHVTYDLNNQVSSNFPMGTVTK
ncbi:hypothetical protein [Owenweeksia hongkongensis]|uniref:hypothetical protein n=1 Tax=Owenweeksia hongkongensis TaxID=253245 RepID=UPI003A953DA6